VASILFGSYQTERLYNESFLNLSILIVVSLLNL